MGAVMYSFGCILCGLVTLSGKGGISVHPLSRYDFGTHLASGIHQHQSASTIDLGANGRAWPGFLVDFDRQPFKENRKIIQ